MCQADMPAEDICILITNRRKVSTTHDTSGNVNAVKKKSYGVDNGLLKTKKVRCIKMLYNRIKDKEQRKKNHQ